MTAPVLCYPVSSRTFEGLDLSIQKKSSKKYSTWEGKCPVCLESFFQKTPTDPSELIKLQPKIVSCTNPEHPHWFHNDCAAIWAKHQVSSGEDKRPNCPMNCWPNTPYKVKIDKPDEIQNLPNQGLVEELDAVVEEVNQRDIAVQERVNAVLDVVRIRREEPFLPLQREKFAGLVLIMATDLISGKITKDVVHAVEALLITEFAVNFIKSKMEERNTGNSPSIVSCALLISGFGGTIAYLGFVTTVKAVLIWTIATVVMEEAFRAMKTNQ